MPSYPEILDYQQTQQRAQVRNREPLNRTKVEVARRAQLITEHPGWALYVRQLEEWLERVQTQHASLLHQMAEGPDLGESLGHLKLAIAKVDSEIKVLTRSLDIIPALIQQGEQARAELKSL